MSRVKRAESFKRARLPRELGSGGGGEEGRGDSIVSEEKHVSLSKKKLQSGLERKFEPHRLLFSPCLPQRFLSRHADGISVQLEPCERATGLHQTGGVGKFTRAAAAAARALLLHKLNS